MVLALVGVVAGSSASVLDDPEVGGEIKNLIETEFGLKRKAAGVGTHTHIRTRAHTSTDRTRTHARLHMCAHTLTHPH